MVIILFLEILTPDIACPIGIIRPSGAIEGVLARSLRFIYF